MSKPRQREKAKEAHSLAIFLVPCSCGRNIVVSENGLPGPHGRHLRCPSCGKKHDRHYRAIRLDYEKSKYWRSGGC